MVRRSSWFKGSKARPDKIHAHLKPGTQKFAIIIPAKKGMILRAVLKPSSAPATKGFV
jgi:hypothetical protein